jgi:hypothetical protein
MPKRKEKNWNDHLEKSVSDQRINKKDQNNSINILMYL